MRTRTRSTPGINQYRAKVELWRRPSGSTGPVTNLGDTVPWGTWNASPSNRSREVTLDENHRIHNPHLLREKSGDLGGTFDSIKVGISGDANGQYLTTAFGPDGAGNDLQYRYLGPVLAVDPSTLSVDSSNSLRRNLKPIGTTAISRCKPTNHVSDLAIDMFEIYREGLPRLPGTQLWKEKTHKARSIGSEYLNSEFGWKPLVSDIRNASYAAANSSRLMKSYEENSGKPVRRSYAFPVEETHSSVDLGPSDGFIQYSINWYGGFADQRMSQPHVIRTNRFLRETWFSGCFTYHLPTMYHSRFALDRIASKAAHLYGVELTPNVVWNAMPWTWAIDWFSNMGDVVSNLSDWATDGLVMRYGYLMEHIVQETTYALDRPCRFKLQGGGHAQCSPVSVYYESKQRVRATPFGFEISWNSLSLRQLAIAAALGIPRLFS